MQTGECQNLWINVNHRMRQIIQAFTQERIALEQKRVIEKKSLSKVS